MAIKTSDRTYVDLRLSREQLPQLERALAVAAEHDPDLDGRVAAGVLLSWVRRRILRRFGRQL